MVYHDLKMYTIVMCIQLKFMIFSLFRGVMRAFAVTNESRRLGQPDPQTNWSDRELLYLQRGRL